MSSPFSSSLRRRLPRQLDVRRPHGQREVRGPLRRAPLGRAALVDDVELDAEPPRRGREGRRREVGAELARQPTKTTRSTASPRPASRGSRPLWGNMG